MSVADDVVKELHATILKTLEAFKGELATVRTGRASLHMLDGVRVDYYGTATPLNQVATLSVPEPRMIVAKPWEKNLIPVIEKAIRDANLGFNPMSDKDMVRVPIPPLTEERRKRDRQAGEAQGRGVQGRRSATSGATPRSCSRRPRRTATARPTR